MTTLGASIDAATARRVAAELDAQDRELELAAPSPSESVQSVLDAAWEDYTARETAASRVLEAARAEYERVERAARADYLRAVASAQAAAKGSP